MKDILQRKTNYGGKDRAVQDRHDGGPGNGHVRNRDSQADQSGHERHSGELNHGDQINVVIFKHLGDGDDMSGNEEGADCGDQIAPVEADTATGGQKPDARYGQRDAKPVHPADAIAPDQLGNDRNEQHEQVVQHTGPRDAGPLNTVHKGDVGQAQRHSHDHAAL